MIAFRRKTKFWKSGETHDTPRHHRSRRHERRTGAGLRRGKACRRAGGRTANGAMASFTVGGSASGTGACSEVRGKGRLRTAHRTTGTVARPAAVSSPPSSSQPTCPIPRHRKPSTAGATANAAPRPMSCTPTYSLCAWAGASSKLSAKTAAAWHISPTEWTATAASKTAAAAHAGRLAAKLGLAPAPKS